MAKDLLFSVTASDCDWDYVRGTGAGGQKRNKTSSKVRCTHRASGAVGVDDSTRSQHQNKQKAFLKMSMTKEFKAWHKMECAKKLGLLQDIDKKIDEAMLERNLKVEVRVAGRWAAE